MNAREYYLAQLNKIAKFSKAVVDTIEFSNFVAVAYEEDGGESQDETIGYLPMLHLFLYQVYSNSLASCDEFDEMMKDYDLNKIYNTSLRDVAENLIIVNGILIDQENEDAF